MLAIYSQEGRVCCEHLYRGMGRTPEPWHPLCCCQGTERLGRNMGTRGCSCPGLVPKIPLSTWTSCKVHPLRTGTPRTLPHQGRTCPRSPGYHPRGVNPWGGPGWERDRAESVLVCQRSGYRSGYCRCCWDVLGPSQPSASPHCHGEHGHPFPSSTHAPVQQ